jgi:hypothetical protein
MSNPDELLADARNALAAFKQALEGKGDRIDTAAQLGARVEELFDHMDATGPQQGSAGPLGWMADARLDRLEEGARAGHASPSQMLKLIAEVRRHRNQIPNPKETTQL